VIMQAPPLPPDPEVIIPIMGMLTGIVITGFVVLGPVGRAIGDIIRHIFGAHRKDQAALGAGDVDEIVGRLDAIQGQLGELAERQDFTDRMLAQVRKDRALPGSSDVAG
jgi:hypothetical protein